MLFKEVMEMWLEEKKNYIKTSTYAHYHYEVNNYLSPLFGDISISDMSEELIQESVLRWQREGAGTGQPLKKSTVQNLVMVIKQIMRYSMKKGYVNNLNLEIHFAPPSYAEKRNKVFSEQEQEYLISALLAEMSFRNFGILLCINSGLRIGEVCALKWSDFDMERKILRVTKTLQRVYMKNESPRTRLMITAPKTVSSIREVPLSVRLFNILSRLAETGTDYYILTNTDKPMEPRTFRKYYECFLQEHDITHFNFHCLRHTFATRCIESGADYKSVSEILGHTTINTTLNMYVHPKMEEKRKCVDLIQW